MAISDYRRHAIKAIRSKEYKQGVKYMLRNRVQVSLLETSMHLNVVVGGLLSVNQVYLLGSQYTSSIKELNLFALANVAEPLIALARLVGVKTPTSTKKAKLLGTRGNALLDFSVMSSMVLNQVYSGARNLSFVTVEKNGKTVKVVDKQAETEKMQERLAELKPIVHGMIDLFWRICFDSFGESPDKIFNISIEDMKQRHGEALFAPISTTKE